MTMNAIRAVSASANASVHYAPSAPRLHSLCRQALRVAPFKETDKPAEPPAIVRWHDLWCFHMECHGRELVKMAVPELSDGYKARSYLYQEMINARQKAKDLLCISCIWPYSISLYCVFLRNGYLSMLGCISEPISSAFFNSDNKLQPEKWQQFILRSRLYRMPFLS